MIISSNDPFKRIVVLKKETWNKKILVNHPEVKDYLDEFKSLINNPYYILRDLFEPEPGNKIPHATREEYLDLIPSKTSSGMVVLKLVVDHYKEPGEIVTVFKSNKLRGLTTEGGVVYVRS